MQINKKSLKRAISRRYYFVLSTICTNFATDYVPILIMTSKILITGASGFIGSFIVEEALNKGMEVWAAVRHTSSKK